MDIAAKQELARYILAVHDRREASWDPTREAYTTPLHGAVELVVRDEDLKIIVLALLTSGYCEVFEWAESILLIQTDQRMISA